MFYLGDPTDLGQADWLLLFLSLPQNDTTTMSKSKCYTSEDYGYNLDCVGWNDVVTTTKKTTPKPTESFNSNGTQTAPEPYMIAIYVVGVVVSLLLLLLIFFFVWRRRKSSSTAASEWPSGAVGSSSEHLQRSDSRENHLRRDNQSKKKLAPIPQQGQSMNEYLQKSASAHPNMRPPIAPKPLSAVKPKLKTSQSSLDQISRDSPSLPTTTKENNMNKHATVIVDMTGGQEMFFSKPVPPVRNKTKQILPNNLNATLIYQDD